MSEDLNIESQEPIQDKTKILYDAVSKDYNIGSYDEFSKKLQDPTKRKAFYDGVGHEYNLGSFDDFSAKVGSTELKKKDQAGATSQVSGQVSFPTESPLPSQKDNLEGFNLKTKTPTKNYYTGSEFDLNKAKQSLGNAGLIFDRSGKLIPSSSQVLTTKIPKAEQIDLGKPTEKDLVEKSREIEPPVEQPKPEEGSWWNVPANLLEQTFASAADIDIATVKLLRNLYGKLPLTEKPQDIYDEKGQLTNYGKNIQSLDFMGKAIKDWTETQQKDQELLQTKYSLPNTTAGKITSSLLGIAPDVAAAYLTGGENLFSGTSRLAQIGNAVTSAFVREQAIKGAAKAYKESNGKSAGETLADTIKGGSKSAGQAALYELATFGGNQIGGLIGKGLTNATAKSAINVGSRLTLASIGVPLIENKLEGKDTTQDDFLQSLGVGGAMEILHGVFGKGGETKVPEQNFVEVANKINDVRAASAVNNFMKAPPDVITDLVNSNQTAENLNSAAADAIKRAESMPDGEEKDKVSKTAQHFAQLADIKHITDMIANSPDALDHMDLPESIKDEFIQKSKAIHSSLNPTEVQKQSHVDNIAQAEDIIKQNESLASSNNPNIKERLDAQREIDKAKATIDESTNEFNKTSDEQDAQKQALQEAKLAQKQASDVNDFANRIASGERMQSPEDLQFYDNNKKAIEETLKAKQAEEVKKSNIGTENAFPVSELNKIPKGELHRTEEAKNILKEDILKNGIKEPLTLVYYVKDNALRLKEGHHRLDAANKLGLKDVPIKVQVEWENSIKDDKDIQGQKLYHPPTPLDVEGYKKRNYQPSNIKLSELGFKENIPTEQLKPKENAVQEPSTGSVLQYPQEGVGEARGERERVEPSIKGTETTKESKQAKIDEEKGLSMKGIRASETRKLNQEASKIEASDARSAALKYLSGGDLSEDAINELLGSKRATLNISEKKLRTEEVRDRDYVNKKGGGESIDDAAHRIWQDLPESIKEGKEKVDTQEIKNKLEDAILEHKTKAEAAKALIDGYKETDIEEGMNKYYEQFANDNPDKMDEEMAKLEESMSDPEDDNYEFDYPEEHINNLMNQYEKESETKAEQPTEGNKAESAEEISGGKISAENERKAESSLITHAANAETREKLGLEQPEILSNLTEKERYDKAQEMLKKGYDMNALIDKMYNPEEVLNPIENAISNLYKQSLLSEIEKNPSDENLALAKKFLDARDQANSRAGATLQSLKGEAPENSLLDFYVNKMEDNKVDVLTDKQKEEAKKEYEAIKAKLDIVEAKNKELEKLNSELLAKKAIDEQKGTKKTTKEKRDYTAERKEVIDSIKEKLKKARTGESGVSAVPVPYAKELIEIAPDVAKLAKLYIEEGAEKLEDVVTKIHGVLKDEIGGLQKKDVQDVLAGKYGKPSKARTEIEKKLSDLKTEARLLDKIEEAKQLKPKTERERVEQNKTLTDLRKELNKVRRETGYYDEARLKSIIERNKKETQNLKDKLEKGDFAEKEKPVSFIENPEIKKKYPELYKQYLDAVDAKDEQQHQYELKRTEEQMNSLSKNERIQAQAKKFVKEGFSTVKALKAGIDNSAVFVQNGLAVLNPMNIKATIKAGKAQWFDAVSEARFRRRIVEVHENKPLWNLIKESGLDYLDPKGYNQAMRDEQFGSSNWLERKIKIGNKEIQIAKYTTAPFERLFTSFSNEFRLQVFLRGAEQLAKEGKTIDTNPQEYKDLASYVNNITGRGKIHESLKPAENVISGVIWAPKLLASSLNLVGAGDLANLGTTKGYYRSMTPRMRRYAITQTAAGIGTGVALMAAYSLLPNKQVDWDPESVTFGQVKDTESGWSYNIFGRLTPIIRYVAMMTMLKKKIGEGKATAVDPLKETYKFFRGKMNPTAGIISDVMMRKDFSGKPYKLSNVPSDLFEPLFISDLRQQLAIDGVSTLLTKGIPAFYGLKVSNDKMYDKRDLKSLESTVDSSTIDKDTLFNYNENRPVNKQEYNEFVTKRDNLLKDYYKSIHENGVPVEINGKAEVLPIDSKELTKELLTKELNRLKGLATKNAKKDLFGLKELSDEQLDLNDDLKDLREKQGIGNQEEQNQ